MGGAGHPPTARDIGHGRLPLRHEDPVHTLARSPLTVSHLAPADSHPKLHLQPQLSFAICQNTQLLTLGIILGAAVLLKKTLEKKHLRASSELPGTHPTNLDSNI